MPSPNSRQRRPTLPLPSQSDPLRDLIQRAHEFDVQTGALTQAIKREWGGHGVASSEPYLTNGAWRAVVAVLNEMERQVNVIASTDPRR